MLLIVLTFAYIAFTTVNFGVCVNSLFRTRTTDFATTSMLGLFAISALTSIWALFMRVNWEFHVALLGMNLLLLTMFRSSIGSVYRLLRFRFRKLPAHFRLFFILTAVLIVARSASAPLLPDNESYYIQTVKWLNEYGFVKGLANLHVFLAQMSGWHIAQSAFSFSFLASSCNDLSGYCLLLANLFALLRLDDYVRTRERIALVMGLFPIANVFVLQFSGSPSPDVPVFVLTFMILDALCRHFEQRTRDTFMLICLLTFFALYVKVTALAISIIPLTLLLRDFRKLMSMRLALAGLCVLALFVARNVVTSGLALFPLPYSFGLHFDHTLPAEIAGFFFSESRPFPFGLTKAQYDSMPLYEIIWRWMQLPKLHGFFNTIGIVLMLISPPLILRQRNQQPIWIAYLAMAAQLGLLLWLSPQYRFFMNFILFFGLFCLTTIVFSRKVVYPLMGISAAASCVIVFFPFDLTRFSSNPLMQASAAFKPSQLIVPHSNSQSASHFERIRCGNFDYFSPVPNDFFWKTADGPLPCVNKDQLYFFEQRFGIRPQLRAGALSHGFRCEPVRASTR